ncbi:hypothetical protein AU14_13705 [Marinobacter similis]|uniref:O-antigen ligase-related domain-containing protein n=2 Tax=Marinobacter similis TaxID=1420916 RepID=W5YUJ0_9GAMM|nr:hypothetical protein AU14_13705 [Marinobacter similis]
MIRRGLVGGGFLLAASPLFAYLALALSSMLWAENPDSSKTFRAATQLLALFVLFSYLRLTDNTFVLRRALLIACMCTAVVAAWHLIVVYGVMEAPWATVLYGVNQQELALYGVKPVNAVLATLLVVPQAALLLGLLLEQPDRNLWLRGLGYLSLLVLVTMIIALERRTGQVAIVVAIAACAVLYRNRIWYMLLGLAVFAGLLILIFFPDFILSRGLSWRPSIWLATIDEIGNAPFFGHGITNTVRPVEVYDSVVGVMRNFRHPHNMALSVTYALGFLGLILWLALWVPGVLARVFSGQRRVEELYILLPVIVGVVALMFDGGEPLSTFHFNWFCFWIPIVLLLSSQAFYGAMVSSDEMPSRIRRIFPSAGVSNSGLLL